MHLFFIFVASIDSVINFRVRLEDVYCGSNETIFFRYSIWTINECQREVSEESRKFNS